MKYLQALIILSSLALSLFTPTATAQSLCDPACELIINFTNGGSLQAVEALSVTFGEGGFINDGIVTTGYAKDEILTLNPGQSLQFSAGGTFNLGAAGNIDYSAMNITASGDFTLSTPTGGTVSFHGVSVFAIAGHLTLNADASLSADLDLSSSNVSFPSSSTTLASGTGTLTVEPEGSLILNNNLLNISNATLTVNQINLQQSSDATGTLTLDPGSTPEIPEGPISITALTQQNLVALEGVTLPTDNGSSCTVKNGQCIDADGNIFSLVEGRLVSAQNKSGSISLFTLLSLFILILLSRYRVSHKTIRIFTL